MVTISVLLRNKVVLALMAASAAIGVLAGGLAVNTAMAPIKARILHLEAATRQLTIGEDEVAAWEERVEALEESVPAAPERINQLISRVARLEQMLPYPVVGTDSVQDHLNETVALYGMISRITKSSSGHLFIELDGGKGLVVWFGCPYDKADLGLDIGDGLVAVGTVKEYNGKHEVIVESENQLFVGD